MYRSLLPLNALAHLGFILLALGALLRSALGFVAAKKLADGAVLDVSYTQAGLVGGLLIRAGLLVLAWALLAGEPGRERSIAERCVGTAAAVVLVLGFAFAG